MKYSNKKTFNYEHILTVKCGIPNSLLPLPFPHVKYVLIKLLYASTSANKTLFLFSGSTGGQGVKIKL